MQGFTLVVITAVEKHSYSLHSTLNYAEVDEA